MVHKTVDNQVVARRAPKQDRAHLKIDLIFEASMHLLDNIEISGLTTNAIAAKAGISIGTLYQYFDGKNAILDALSNRELQGLASKIVGAVSQTVSRSPEQRSKLLVGAVFESYGGRRRVHRILLEHALSQRRTSRLNPLYSALAQELSREGRAGPQLNPAEAFVLMHAIGGVLRAVATGGYPAAKRGELEEALARLLTGFVRS
jgi:AcrR family transcriptional regulator